LSFSTCYSSRIYGALRLAGFLALIIVFMPVLVGFTLFRREKSVLASRVFYRLTLRVFGFRVRAHGAMTNAQPTLFVSNHASYLDVPVLGALIPAVFVAKAEVAGWPVIGFLCKLHHTVFIERRSVRAGEQRDHLRDHLGMGQSLVLFPEGTSSDGLFALPFKSSLFSTVETGADDIAIAVQPVSVVCTGIAGLPLPRAWRPYYAWFGDMTFVAHFWNVLKCGGYTVDVVFHPPVTASYGNRKQLAAYCQEEVARGIEQCLTGRSPEHADMPQLPAPA
jgi:1-acyl-sn-glycerol-3-phosphate acyltransferase